MFLNDVITLNCNNIFLMTSFFLIIVLHFLLMYFPKIKNSIKSISNINDAYLHLIQVIPKISNKNDYYFILIFEEEIEYKTDPLCLYDAKNINNNQLNIDINNYLKRLKDTISITGEVGNDYIIDDITIQDLLYYVFF